MVRELSKHQCCFLFDCCIVIARFASLCCYSSAKTRIRPVKSYQINKSFCSITHCALLHTGWSGGREARKDYGTRSFGCNRDLCPFQVRGRGGVRLASSSLATAMACKLTTYVASRSSACLWVGR